MVETRGFNCSRGLFFVCSKFMTKKIIIFQVKFRKWFNSLLVNSYSRTIRSNSWLVLELILYSVGTIHEAKICSTLGVTKKIISIILSLILYSQDLVVISLLWLLHMSLEISYKNLVLDKDDNFYLMSLSIYITYLLVNIWIL